MRTSVFVGFSLPVVFSAVLAAQTNSGYNQPDKPILDVMHAPASPRPYVSPTDEDMLLVAQEEYPSITRVATPFLRLAGVRVEPIVLSPPQFLILIRSCRCATSRCPSENR